MNKNILNVDPFYLTAGVEKCVCPLNWLAEYYNEYPGKLVMIDNNLLSFLLNEFSKDEILVDDFDGFKQTFTIKWNATKEYPETVIVVSSYGKDEIGYSSNKIIVDSNKNYYVIEKLIADDLLVDNQPYAKDMKTDRQILMLTSVEKTDNISL